MAKKTQPKLTERERELLAQHGYPWHESYWPTIRVDERSTPTRETINDALALRSAVVKLGIGYFDGDKTIGRRAS